MGRKKLKRKPEPKRRIRWPRWTGISGSTLRDWLPIVGALLIPLLIFYGTARITGQQGKLENDRVEAEQDLAEQRAQDEALQAYLDQMSNLMLDRKLLEAEQGDPVHTLAQARTSTAILSLDAEHNESVIRFLTDSGLAGSAGSDEATFLDEANASVLRGITLSRATLSGADLRQADLAYVDLSGADLSNASLSIADLRGADLRHADLRHAALDAANLSPADLRHANLFEANLNQTFLRGADLRHADLRHVTLFGVHLSGAGLSGADLSGAEGILNEEIAQQAASLEGATMPNGQKYEAWLKDREKRKQDE